MKAYSYLMFVVISMASCSEEAKYKTVTEDLIESEHMSFLEKNIGITFPSGSKIIGLKYKSLTNPDFIAKVKVPEQKINTLLYNLSTLPDSLGEIRAERMTKDLNWWLVSDNKFLSKKIFEYKVNRVKITHCIEETNNVFYIICVYSQYQDMKNKEKHKNIPAYPVRSNN